MDTHQNHAAQDMEKLKEIPKWTIRYTQNRTLPNLAGLVIFLCIFAGIGGFSYLSGIAYFRGNTVLFWISNCLLAVTMIALAFFSTPKWGGKFRYRLSKRIYGNEGDVSISSPELMKKKGWVGYAVAMVFGSCVFISVILGFLNYLPIKYMQPFSALYVVPFMVFLYFWQRPKVGAILLLWPILYTVHAILIVGGVPISFTRNWTPLNMMLPTFGYGFLTFIIGHVYSRYALKKLKTAAHLQEDSND